MSGARNVTGIELSNPLGLEALPAGLREIANVLTGIGLVAGAGVAVASVAVMVADF